MPIIQCSLCKINMEVSKQQAHYITKCRQCFMVPIKIFAFKNTDDLEQTGKTPEKIESI